MWNSGEVEKEKRIIVLTISKYIISAGRKLLNNGGWGERVRKSNRRG
jgi:hypothetical protein